MDNLASVSTTVAGQTVTPTPTRSPTTTATPSATSSTTPSASPTASATSSATRIATSPINTPTATLGYPDADGDGVPDSADLCPGTAPGSFVNSNGCPGNKMSLANHWWSVALLAGALAGLHVLVQRRLKV